MKILAPLIAALVALVVATPASAACAPGAYGAGDGDFVVLVPVPSLPPPALRYQFRDGRRGSTADPDGLAACVDDAAAVRTPTGTVRWPRLATTETDTRFNSLDTGLAGQLIEPATPDPRRPLVVLVHGSERTSPRGGSYVYALVAQGIAVFAYDKRGTGDSQGEYTQNFELLADDAAAALAEARRIAAGRFGRAGYFGGSQGGWVAPLAATRSRADFVAVGFGLVASPIEEDRDQMLSEARALGLDEAAMRQIDRLSQATARLMTSHFSEGFDALEALRRELQGAPWTGRINGEHSGAMLRLDDAELRRIGRARFDNLELIWDYDAIAALRRVNVPLLWILAGEDREAPIEGTRHALSGLIAEGRPIDLYLFPDTDHGMVEFTTDADGTRRTTRITDGYVRLLGDWIRGGARGPYGRAERLR
jgi:hypothetical protein